MGTVINITAALHGLVEALEAEVAECRQIVAQTQPNSWQHKVGTAALIEAERRLTAARTMHRDWPVGQASSQIDWGAPVSQGAGTAGGAGV